MISRPHILRKHWTGANKNICDRSLMHISAACCICGQRYVAIIFAIPGDHLLLNYPHGLRISQACSHCHVESSPRRVEMATKAVAERCIKVRVVWWVLEPFGGQTTLLVLLSSNHDLQEGGIAVCFFSIGGEMGAFLFVVRIARISYPWVAGMAPT